MLDRSYYELQKKEKEIRISTNPPAATAPRFRLASLCSGISLYVLMKRGEIVPPKQGQRNQPKGQGDVNQAQSWDDVLWGNSEVKTPWCVAVCVCVCLGDHLIKKWPYKNIALMVSRCIFFFQYLHTAHIYFVQHGTVQPSLSLFIYTLLFFYVVTSISPWIHFCTPSGLWTSAEIIFLKYGSLF